MDYVGDCSIKDNDDKYAWNDFYNVAGDYVYIRKGIISMMKGIIHHIMATNI